MSALASILRLTPDDNSIPAAQFPNVESPSSLLPWPLLCVAATTFAIVIPFFFLGDASGHDFEFHINSWMEVLSQWKHGIFYPHWAALAHYGYGEPRFIFYPPASWIVGALLGTLLPWKFVSSAYIWIALTLSGCAMFCLARRYLKRREGILAAMLYAANPYHVVIVYWRSAFAELLASALLPLLLMLILRIADRRFVDEERLLLRTAVLPLALVIAASWLTNLPAAVMVNYSTCLLIVAMALLRRSPRILLHGAVATILAAGLASFYILPAAYEGKWVNIAEVLSPGVRPQDNFMFTPSADMDHNRFNLLVSMVGTAEFVALAGAGLLLSRRRRPRQSLTWALFIWTSAAALLMFPLTTWIWKLLPNLRFVQLPWRWLLCLNVGFAMLIPMAWKRWPARVVVYLTMLAVIGFAWVRVQPPWWESAGDINELQDNLESGAGYEGTDEYVPIGADAYELNRAAPPVLLEEGVPAQISVRRWDAEFKEFTVVAKRPAKVVLRLFSYPAWKVSVNGSHVSTEKREITQQMTIPVKPGENLVQVRFTRTWDRTAGIIISLATLCLVALYIVLGRRTAPKTTS